LLVYICENWASGLDGRHSMWHTVKPNTFQFLSYFLGPVHAFLSENVN
jgi:hypothetical protein